MGEPKKFDGALKACPFCGSPAALTTGDVTMLVHYCECSNKLGRCPIDGREMPVPEWNERYGARDERDTEGWAVLDGDND